MNKKTLQFSYSFTDNRVPPKIIANILRRAGASTTICYLFDNNTSNEKMTAYNGCDSHSFNHGKNSRSNNKLSNLIKLYKILKKGQFDTIITHRYKPFFLTLLISRLLKNTQYYAVFHGNGSFRLLPRRLICRWLLHDNWTLVTVSESVKNDILSTLGTTKASMKVIYNCLDMATTQQNLLSKQQARKKLNLDPQSFIFGCTARLVSGKGLHHLLDAFAELNTDKMVQLAIIGDGCEREQLSKQAQKLGLQDRIKFCGWRDDAAIYATAFDTFILPTTNEGFGLVLLEAACAKIPIIASVAGGIPEVAENTEIILVQPRDNVEMVSAMKKILAIGDVERNKLGERIYQQLYNKFDISRIAPAYYQLLGIEEG